MVKKLAIPQRVKRTQRKGKKEEQTEKDEVPVPLSTHVNSNLHSLISNVEVYINNQPFANQMDSMRTNFTCPKTSQRANSD